MLKKSHNKIKFTFFTVALIALPFDADAGTISSNVGARSSYVSPSYGKNSSITGGLQIAQRQAGIKSSRMVKPNSTFWVNSNSHARYSRDRFQNRNVIHRNVIPGSFLNSGYGYSVYPYNAVLDSQYGADYSAPSMSTRDYQGDELQTFVAAPKVIHIETVKIRRSNAVNSFPKVVYGSNSIITPYTEPYIPNIVRVRVLKN